MSAAINQALEAAASALVLTGQTEWELKNVSYMLLSLGLGKAGESDMQTSEETHDLTPKRGDIETDRNWEGQGSHKLQGNKKCFVLNSLIRPRSATFSIIILMEIWILA